MNALHWLTVNDIMIRDIQGSMQELRNSS